MPPLCSLPACAKNTGPVLLTDTEHNSGSVVKGVGKMLSRPERVKRSLWQSPRSLSGPPGPGPLTRGGLSRASQLFHQESSARTAQAHRCRKPHGGASSASLGARRGAGGGRAGASPPPGSRRQRKRGDSGGPAAPEAATGSATADGPASTRSRCRRGRAGEPPLSFGPHRGWCRGPAVWFVLCCHVLGTYCFRSSRPRAVWQSVLPLSWPSCSQGHQGSVRPAHPGPPTSACRSTGPSVGPGGRLVARRGLDENSRRRIPRRDNCPTLAAKGSRGVRFSVRCVCVYMRAVCRHVYGGHPCARGHVSGV
ncbi:uncharacterized protein LOC128312259 [Acinonyx jubatus]|uniref:Uncharacterized protein LOC128312259 n=1 Tax=Acinonyx jubatus TaxID=32536 RepID=A0ABM3NPJ4_ACIJB|nr:uncharacterized protein LOC128312259 [Acinonyx jubatus]XP_053061334.1 uncharacterized protein LOC128312259 [Acinonyx jubatus]XP_053061335.1 uncharacterized protein LOC128312259 [Acinonyx jubatus]